MVTHSTQERIVHVKKAFPLLEQVDFWVTRDMVKNPKPEPDIYLKILNENSLNNNETIIIEDSLVGVKAGVAAGVRVIVITAGSHWHSERSTQEFYEAGVFEVVNSFTEMLKLINKL